LALHLGARGKGYELAFSDEPGTHWAISIPISGDNTFYAIPLKNAIFWLLISVAAAVGFGYLLKPTHS